MFQLQRPKKAFHYRVALLPKLTSDLVKPALNNYFLTAQILELLELNAVFHLLGNESSQQIQDKSVHAAVSRVFDV